MNGFIFALSIPLIFLAYRTSIMHLVRGTGIGFKVLYYCSQFQKSTILLVPSLSQYLFEPEESKMRGVHCFGAYLLAVWWGLC